VLLAKNGIVSSIKKRKQTGKWKGKDIYTIQVQDCFLEKMEDMLEIKIDRKRKMKNYSKAFIYKNFLWMPVKKVKRIKFEGTVFNLQVKDTSTYVVNSILCHNCDIWKYIKKENIPVVSLYFAKNGKRYRSIGCKTCCSPIPSNAKTIDEIIEELQTTKISERAGRAQDKESLYMMQKLRTLGYM